MTTLFRFRKIDKYLLSSLVNSEIHFARPNSLNDPFDCRVDILNALENAIKRIHSPARDNLEKLRGMTDFFVKVQFDLEQVGVCSCSLELNNSLMWSHYADNHRGICLTYCFPDKFFFDNAAQILGIDRVEYGNNPLSDWFIQKASNLGSFKEFGISLIQKSLTLKAQIWDYEKEIRIIRRTEGVQGIDKSYLKQVCFGLDAPESDVTLIRKLLNQIGYDVITCKMKRSTETDFEFQAIEI